ncbi:MAG: oligosaccharide flippase family protein [Euzebyaceae bacterium]|nr:oligosaccharide flippase family protein [Euzebyaceae bacterium]
MRRSATLAEEAPPRPELSAPGRAADLSTLARGGALNLVGAVGYGLLNFLLLIVLSRGLGPGGAGAFIEAMAVFAILNQAAVLGADTGLVRLIARSRGLGQVRDIRPALAGALVPVVAVAAAFGLAVTLAAPQLARIFGGDNHVEAIATYLRILAPFLPLSAAYWTLASATRGFGTMIPSVVIDKLAKPAAQPLLVVAAITGGLGPAALALAWASPAAVAVVPTGWWLWRLLRRAERDHGLVPARDRRELFREFWRFTLPRALASWFRVAEQWLDVLLVGALISPRAAGIYAAATRLLQMGNYVALAIAQVAEPMFSELLAGRRSDRARGVFQTATAWLMTVSWPPYLALAIFAPVVLRLFGPAYVEGATVVTVLALARILATGVGPVDIVLLMAGRSSLSSMNAAAALSANVALNLVLIPRYGLVGAALAWVVSTAINNLAPLAQVWRSLRMHPFGTGFRHVAAASVACYGVLGLAVRQLLGLNLAALAVYGVLATVGYLALMRRHREAVELPALWRAVRSRRTGARPRAAANGPRCPENPMTASAST